MALRLHHAYALVVGLSHAAAQGMGRPAAGRAGPAFAIDDVLVLVGYAALDLESAVNVDVWVLQARVAQGVLLEGLGHDEVQAAAGSSAHGRRRHVEHVLLVASGHWMTLRGGGTGGALVVLLRRVAVLRFALAAIEMRLAVHHLLILVLEILLRLLVGALHHLLVVERLHPG